MSTSSQPALVERLRRATMQRSGKGFQLVHRGNTSPDASSWILRKFAALGTTFSVGQFLEQAYLIYPTLHDLVIRQALITLVSEVCSLFADMEVSHLSVEELAAVRGRPEHTDGWDDAFCLSCLLYEGIKNNLQE